MLLFLDFVDLVEFRNGVVEVGDELRSEYFVVTGSVELLDSQRIVVPRDAFRAS